MLCLLKKEPSASFIFGLLLLVLVAGCKDGQKQIAIPKKIQKVEVLTVQREAFQETIVASALASAHLEYRVSTEISGTLKAKHVERGDHVKKGMVLFEIDPEMFQLRIKEQTAILSRSEAHLRFMRAEAKRKQPLFESKTLSQSEWDRLQFDLASAVAERDQARVVLDQSKRDLRLTTLVSPIDGTLLKEDHDVGEVLTVGTALAWIGETSRITFEVGVSDLELTHLTLGDSVSVTVDALSNRHFEGKIIRIAGNASPSQGTFPVDVSVENRAGDLFPGMVGRLTLSGKNYGAEIILPMRVIHQQKGDSFVYSIEKDRVVKKKVKIGVVMGDRVLINKGLKEGESVVVISQGRLEAGDLVQILK